MPSMTSTTTSFAFTWAAFYGFALAALILSGNWTMEFLALFCHKDAYTLGNFGQVWAHWHAVGCAFVGLTNLSCVRDARGGFGPDGKVAVAQNTAFIFGVWGVQNVYYCVTRDDLFTPLMWLNAIACLGTAVYSLQAAHGITSKSTGKKA
ncbi:unnamed protein product [Polarella glacialis]|uniref:Uncharacterized protein n=1 Tax=Polarella glacialis TaxID=89957 RepID=A0A813IXK0_POLGL|nr:unnamed protein product [Polarella glacialis]